ncbi:MAG: hypothetical protein FWC89_03050 [Defluviitaleaceae bacterium]|nr:hypothetical protein [Defluviitaleaceae bacterium]
MKKNLFALILTVVMISIIAGCASDMADIQDGSADTPRELFTFPSVGSATPPVEADEIDENDETYTEFMEVVETNPSLQDEIVEDIEHSSPNIQPEAIADSVLENPMVVLVGGRENIPPPSANVDIDFTLFRGDDFDEEYFSLMWEMEDSFGKIIRVIGTYDSFFDDYTGRYVHFILIDDAEGCCVLFFEFGWIEGNEPNTFPAQDAIIDLTGVFGELYCPILEWAFQFVVVESLSVL